MLRYGCARGKVWHQKQVKEAMNRDNVRAKKSTLWRSDEHKEMMEGARLNFESAEKRRKGLQQSVRPRYDERF